MRIFQRKIIWNNVPGDAVHLQKILSCINIVPHSKILDLGTGSGFLAFPIAQDNSESTVVGLRSQSGSYSIVMIMTDISICMKEEVSMCGLKADH